jgi:hypothetical protein
MMNSKFIERQIHNLVKTDPAAKLKLLTIEIKEIWGQDVSYFKIWDAKQKAIGNIYRDCDKSYEELPKFLLEVPDRYPGTQVEYQNIHTNHAGTNFFSPCFLSVWSLHYRVPTL